RLEQLLLLIVRCLVLLLLVVAMLSVTDWAENLWRKMLPNSVKRYARDGTRAHKILVLDGSFSMAFRPEDRDSNFERARASGVQVVRTAPSGDAFSVALMSSAGRFVVSEPSESADKVVEEIEKVRLPHAGADVGSTFTSVATLLKESPPKYTRKEVFFFTDLQQSTWIAQNTSPVTALLQMFKERRAATVFVDVGQDEAPNLALTSLAMLDDVATTEQNQTLFLANLHNYGGKSREKLRVKFLVGRGRSPDNDADFSLDVKQERNNVGTQTGQDTPLALAHHVAKPGDYVVEVQVETDPRPLDDARSAVVRVRKDTQVLIVNGRYFGNRLDQSAGWLNVALDPYEGRKDRPPDA